MLSFQIVQEAPSKKPTDDSDNTDYTAGVTNDDDNLEDADQEQDDVDETTDYTATEDEESPDATPEDTDQEQDDGTGTEEDGDDTTDYTDGSDNTDTDDGTDVTDGSESTDEGDLKKNKLLLKDFTNLYYITKNSIVKLSNIDKTDIFINKIVTQVVYNLSTLQQYLYEFITGAFSKGKYVNNLYQYNYFLEAFKINVEMLKKISVFMSN